MKKIYILDDDGDFLQLMEEVLAKNYIIGTRTHLDVGDFSRFGPDLILLDHFLGNVKGDIVLWELEKSIPHFSVPIIMMSGQDSDPYKHSPLVKGFIPKPSSIHHIKKTLNDFFGAHKS